MTRTSKERRKGAYLAEELHELMGLLILIMDNLHEIILCVKVKISWEFRK